MKKTMGWVRLLCLSCLLLLMGGCVQSEVGLNFSHQHHGQIIQRIRLSDPFSMVSQLDAQPWLQALDNRVQQTHGQLQQVSPQEVLVSIPFSDTKELVSQFNQFFQTKPGEEATLPDDTMALATLQPQLSLEQQNWLLAEHNRLRLEFDLSKLGIQDNTDQVLISSDTLLDLGFKLQTPWGARAITRSQRLKPEEGQSNTDLNWQLQPGQINLIEAAFWVPNYLGLGTITIVGFICLVYFLKYRRLPLIP